MIQSHPSLFESPLVQQLPLPLPSVMPNNNEKSFGRKIKKAFYITVLFILFMNSFLILDRGQFLFTQRNFEFVEESTKMPTLKGYFVVSFILFCIVLWIINKD